MSAAREDLILKYAMACKRNATEMAGMPISVICQHFREFADELAALSTEPGEAEGMVLVPAMPTGWMLDAGYKVCDEQCRHGGQINNIWRAMIAAAPLPEDANHGR